MKKHFIIRTILIALVVSFFYSCKDNKNSETIKFGTERYDAEALHIALVPNRDCLPIYYAKRMGLYDSLGLKVQIASYPSQLDCDTTLMGNNADGGWADATQLSHYGRRMSNFKKIWPGTQTWQLFICNTLRIKSINALKEHTIAIARATDEETWLNALLKQNKMSADDVFSPQINDLRLRALMLKGNQIDAAILTWPYTSLALAERHHCIAKQNKTSGFFVMKNNAKNIKRAKQWALFEEGRKMALDSMRIKGPKAYSYILQKDYKLPPSVADTIKF